MGIVMYMNNTKLAPSYTQKCDFMTASLSSHLQEAGLRVRAAQLSDVAALLTPLVAGLEQRGLLLRQAMRASRLDGNPGVMSVKQLVRPGYQGEGG
jgi:hypothetical protein